MSFAIKNQRTLSLQFIRQSNFIARILDVDLLWVRDINARNRNTKENSGTPFESNLI